MNLTRQQTMIVEYLKTGTWFSTNEIDQHFLDTEGYILRDLRKRASELKAKGIVDTRRVGKYAEYKLILNALYENDTPESIPTPTHLTEPPCASQGHSYSPLQTKLL